MGKREPALETPPADPRVSGEEPLVRGEAEAGFASVRCPSCKSPDAVLRTFRLDLPYFGEVFESIFICPRCGFRHTDTLLPRVQAAAEHTLLVENDADLSVRAVKSSSATVEVAELGLLWEPGPASTAEVTNVEGLLRHFEDAVGRAMALFADEATNARGKELLDALTRIIAGEQKARIALKDPYGNSALIDPRGKAKRRELGKAEAAELLTGEYIFELGADGPSGLRRADSHEPG